MTESFDEYLAEEIAKYKGVAVPVKSGLLRRALVRQIDPKKLHPNPSDEFCDPKIGPSYEIIGKYEQAIRETKFHANDHPIEENLVVQRMHPDGYMILNGHHRWAAALRFHLKKVPIEIVNETQFADFKEMVKGAKNDKRIALDLDEVVFVSDQDPEAEKKLAFPFNKIYKERLKRGIPALFYFLKNNHYDIWVYSANYYGMDYIRNLFKLYHVQLDGIVTGAALNRRSDEATRKQMKELLDNKYQQSIHLDNEGLTVVNNVTKDFEDYKLSGSAATWSQEVMDIIGALNKHES